MTRYSQTRLNKEADYFERQAERSDAAAPPSPAETPASTGTSPPPSATAKYPTASASTNCPHTHPTKGHPMATATKRTPEQIRDDRNARRRDKRRSDTRLALARHAASYLLHWENDGTRPITTRRVIDQTRYMHFNHREIQRHAITTDEAQTALDEVRQSIRDEAARRADAA